MKKIVTVCLVLLAGAQIVWIFLTPTKSVTPRGASDTEKVVAELPAEEAESGLGVERLARETAVEVALSEKGAEAEAAGTGAIVRVNADGFDVLTAAHILGLTATQRTPAGPIEVKSFFRGTGGSGVEHGAGDGVEGSLGSGEAGVRVHSAVWLVDFDAANDVALLRVVSGELPSLSLQLAKRQPEPPFEAWRIVWDADERPREELVRVVEQRRARRAAEGEMVNFWVCEQSSVPGMSGGPLLSLDGQLLGTASGNSGGQAFYSQAEAVERLGVE